jgi:hypothetical protein
LILNVTAGLFLWNHYREATESVRVLTIEVNILKDNLHLTDDDFIHFHGQEHQYLSKYRQLSVDDQLRIRYVQALDELAARK